MEDNGYRNSYGVVLAMFGLTIGGCFIIRTLLVKMNKDLQHEENVWGGQPDTAEMEEVTDEKAMGMYKGFRYLV